MRRIVAPKAEAEAPALDPELYAKDGRRKWQGSLWRTCFTPCQEHTPAKLSAVVVLALADRRGRCDACKAATHPVAQAWALANTQRLTGKPAAEVKHYVPKELYGLPGPDLPANPAGGRKVPLPGGYGHGDGSIPLFQRSRELYISARDNAPKIAGQPLGDWAA